MLFPGILVDQSEYIPKHVCTKAMPGLINHTPIDSEAPLASSVAGNGEGNDAEWYVERTGKRISLTFRMVLPEAIPPEENNVPLENPLK